MQVSTSRPGVEGEDSGLEQALELRFMALAVVHPFDIALAFLCLEDGLS